MSARHLIPRGMLISYTYKEPRWWRQLHPAKDGKMGCISHFLIVAKLKNVDLTDECAI